MATLNRSATNCDPMDANLLMLFQQEVVNNCEYLIVVTNDLYQHLEFIANNPRDPLLPSVQIRFWMAAQALVIAAANLSKALWGTGDRRVERETLRTSLSVDVSSPLRLREMRNHYEHYDRRLEESHLSDPPADGPRWNLDKVIGDFAGAQLAQAFTPTPRPIEVFRGFNPATNDLTFWGDTFNVIRVTDEAMRILTNAQAQLHPSPPSREEMLRRMSGSGQ